MNHANADNGVYGPEYQNQPGPLRKDDMKMYGRYNWKGQPERLMYLGKNWSGNGYWHQFELVSKPGTVWCEVLDSDLHMLEETQTQENST